jgi:hypothetical protein
MKSLDENTKRLSMDLDLLSQIESTGVNFLTCHLDTSGSRWQTQASFRRMHSKYRHLLSERNKIDFDHAVKMIEVFLESYDAKTDSIIVFCRGILGGQYFLSIPVHEPLGNRIIFRSTPSVTTLTSLIQNHLDENATEHWNINLKLDEDAHDIKQGLLLNKHLERDENSYSLTHDEQNWPAGVPVLLQRRKHTMPLNSLDLVA